MVPDLLLANVNALLHGSNAKCDVAVILLLSA
jgi:hypothetical protein